MLDLLGKYVEVVANGIVYRGKLVEIGEEEVYLEAESGWVAIPVERVITIKEPEA
ncbi:MAG: hypothetical protein M1497_07025 [Nitrospirae bacterium]|nr:hypothetical protein [Nitrospirota bacterium]